MPPSGPKGLFRSSGVDFSGQERNWNGGTKTSQRDKERRHGLGGDIPTEKRFRLQVEKQGKI